MSKILVTGAAGFIGGAVARHAARCGHEVHGIGHGMLEAGGMAARGLRSWREATISAEMLEASGVVPDIVVHCAGGASVRASVESPALDRERTLGATEALVRWLGRCAPAARLVHVSSGAVYGEAAGRPRLRSAALTPISPYGRHKAETEAAVRRAAAEHGSAAVIVRLFSVYGPGLRKQLLWDACHKMQRGDATFHGTGEERRDWIEISDAAALLWRAARAASPDVPAIDGGKGVGTRLMDVLEMLADACDPRPRVRFVGGGRAGDPKDMIADPRDAHALGWSPQVSLEQGIRGYAEWFRSQAV